jgi:hypothetical protein
MAFPLLGATAVACDMPGLPATPGEINKKATRIGWLFCCFEE